MSAVRVEELGLAGCRQVGLGHRIGLPTALDVTTLSQLPLTSAPNGGEQART